ncbi:glycosyltransferase WbuB [Clostridiaceae bacterium]|nr:glycosyltransferase WbuB [Clostridiaceae bacterium]RKI12938.1 glycosyltransferase WbuB [bacterium 1XD21-70]
MKALLFDLRCFLGTIESVLKCEGVIEGGTGGLHKQNSSPTSQEIVQKKESILVVCQYYDPEPFRISNICKELVRRGHEVMVVTGQPNYPEGVLYPGYEGCQKRDEVIDGVQVHRCNIIPRKQGRIYRFLNYYSYAISSTRYIRSGKCITLDKRPFDIVFCNQLSPVMMAEAAIAYKKKYKVPLILYCLDLWPESLIAGGVSRNSGLYKFFHRVSKRIYKSADKIFVTSQMFSDYFYRQFDIKKNDITYLPQYAEDVFDLTNPKSGNKICELMFAGNIGEIQSLNTIVDAAELLKKEPIRFHIVGGGTDLKRVQEIAEKKGLKNVVFYGRRPLEEMPKLYEKADAMLVTLKSDSVLSLTLPGKIQTYLACGKPIIGAIDGECANVIREAECGFCGPAEDSRMLAENIRKFMEADNRLRLGINARKYYLSHFSLDRFMEKLETCIGECTY